MRTQPKRMPKAESFVQTPDGPGNVKSVDLLRETVKVSLDSAPEPLKCYHNCEVCVLRNGKGSREGIAIPERPARYVEPKEAEEFREEAPALMAALLYGHAAGRGAPCGRRSAHPAAATASHAAGIGAAAGEGEPKSGEGVEQPKAEARGPEKKEGRPRPPKQESRPAQPSRQKPDLGRTGRRPRTVKARPSAAAGPTTGGGAAGTKTAARAAVPPQE